MDDRHRIGELDLDITARSHRVAAEVEPYIREVIECAGDELERRHPGHIFCIRELPLDWDLSPAELRLPQQRDAYARQIADAIESLCSGANSRPRPEDGFRFQNLAEYWTAYLEARAGNHQKRLWAFSTLHAESHPFDLLLTSNARSLASEIVAALSRRAFAGFLKLAASASDPTLERLAATLEFDRARTTSSQPDIEAAAARLRSVRKPLTQAALVVYSFGAMLVIRNSPPSPAEVKRIALILSPETVPPAERDVEFPTRFAGAVYLLNLIRELGIDELLWTACLPEGAVLGRALAPLFSPEPDDELVRTLFASPGLAWTDIDLAHQRELALPLAQSLLSALRRRGLVDATPWTSSSLRDGEITWHVLSPPGLPYPFLIVDGDNLPPLEIELREGPPPAWLSIASPEDAMYAQILGSLSILWISALGCDSLEPGALSAEFFDLPAICALSQTEFVVHLPVGRLDIRVRIAGFDRDPGWVAWLRRGVRLHFTGAVEA